MDQQGLERTCPRVDQPGCLDSSLGKGSIYGMVENGPTAASRAEGMGYPIPVFYCSQCRQPIIPADTIQSHADLFEEKERMSGLKKKRCALPGGIQWLKCGKVFFGKKPTSWMSGLIPVFPTPPSWKKRKPVLTFRPAFTRGKATSPGMVSQFLLTSVGGQGDGPPTFPSYPRICGGWRREEDVQIRGNVIAPEEVTQAAGSGCLETLGGGGGLQG